MRTAADIQGLVQATNTRTALEQVEMRLSGKSDLTQGNTFSGLRYTPTGRDLLPVMGTSGNKTSAFENLGNNRRLMVPSGIEINSIIEFTDQAGETHYGQVTGSAEKKSKNITVKDLTVEQAKALQAETNSKIYSISESYVKNYRKPGLVGTILSLLDPSENFVVKLFTMLLVGDIFNSADMMDLFMKLYVRVIVIAGIIILASIIIAHVI